MPSIISYLSEINVPYASRYVNLCLNCSSGRRLQEQFWLKLTYREHSFALMPSIISYLSEIQGLDNEMIEIL